MELSGEQRIPASRERVWEALNDPEVLRRCIPGAESLEKLSDTEFKATVALKIGPVRVKFAGDVTLSDLDPPNSYTISGQGSGGAAGFARGSARVRLSDAGDGATELSYDCDVQVGGKLAQIGSRMISGTATKLAGEFFGDFAAALTESAPTAEEEAVEEAESVRPPAVPAAYWLTGVLIFVVVLLAIVAS